MNLSDFVRKATVWRRRGARKPIESSELKAMLRRIISAQQSIESSENQSEVITASWLMAELLDQLGDEKGLERCVERCEHLCKTTSDTDAVAEIPRMMWMRSIHLHRTGDYSSAAAVTGDLLQTVGPSRHDPSFLPRLLYTHARHLQAARQRDEADKFFTKSIEACRNLKEEVAEEEAHEWARRIASLTLVQFARSALDRGDLEKAWRQLLVAEMLQNSSVDPVHREFLNLQKGRIHRQRGDFDTAVKVLIANSKAFASLGHTRYRIRSLFELASAYFNLSVVENRSVLQEAVKVLDTLERLDKAAPDRFSGNETLDRRWRIRACLLRCRVAIRQKKLPDAAMALSAARENLQQLTGQRAEETALLTAIEGELALSQDQPEKAITVCATFLKNLGAREEAETDVADLAWVILVHWKALLSVDGDDVRREAYDCEHRWREIQHKVRNAYVRRLAREVEDFRWSKSEMFASLGSPKAGDDRWLDYEAVREDLRFRLFEHVLGCLSRSLPDTVAREQAHKLTITEHKLKDERERLRKWRQARRTASPTKRSS